MTKADREHVIRVARLGCAACRKLGIFTPYVEIHHIRHGQGMGRRASHREVIGLCAPHHRTGGHGVAFHAGRETWEATFGTEAELLEWVRQELGDC